MPLEQVYIQKTGRFQNNETVQLSSHVRFSGYILQLPPFSANLGLIGMLLFNDLRFSGDLFLKIVVLFSTINYWFGSIVR